MRLRDFSDLISDDLRDPEVARGLLQDALDDDDPRLFIRVLGDIVKANNFTQVTQAVGINRQAAYVALSGQGNPGYMTVRALLEAIGLELTVTCKDDPVPEMPSSLVGQHVEIEWRHEGPPRFLAHGQIEAYRLNDHDYTFKVLEVSRGLVLLESDLSRLRNNLRKAEQVAWVPITEIKAFRTIKPWVTEEGA